MNCSFMYIHCILIQVTYLCYVSNAYFVIIFTEFIDSLIFLFPYLYILVDNGVDAETVPVNTSFLIINNDAFLLRCKLGKTIISIRTVKIFMFIQIFFCFKRI